MIEDVRYGLLQLRKNPGFAIVAILTLGLGIGAAAAMFGLIQGVLLSPPPYADPGRLVLISPARIDGQPFDQTPTTQQWVGWRAGSQALQEVAMYRWTFNFLVLPDGSESLGGMVVTPNYFRVMGLQPILGREPTEAEAARSNPPPAPGTPPTAIILGHQLWQRRFNSDPNIIGKTVRLSRMPTPLPVVGVMPAGVRFLPDPGTASEPNYDVNAHVDFWLAARLDESRLQSRGWNAVARLRPGVSAAQAGAQVATVAAEQARTVPDLAGLTARVRPLLDVLNVEGRRLLMPLFASVALVFLIACGNVTGLLLARGLQRQPEYAMRSALGANRWRLFRQVLTETVTLAIVGAVVGGVLSSAMVRLFKAIGGDAVPRADAVTVGWPVFAFGLLAALIAAVFAGLLPAARASSSDNFRGLDGARTSAGRAERRLLAGVAGLQIVLTVGLLAGAALLIRTEQNLARIRPGYDTENVLTMTVTAMQSDKWKDFHTRALERVAAIPGVRHAAFVWGLPLTGNKWPGEMEIVGEAGATTLADRLTLPLRAVTPDYFPVMDIPIVEGRGFLDSDDADRPRVAVVNHAFAQQYLAGTALGRQLRFRGDTKNTIQVVGVVSDIRVEALSRKAEPEIYLPLWQSRAFSKHLIVRTTSDPRALAARIRSELHGVDPTAAVEHVKTMTEIRQESVAERTFAMYLLTGFAIGATLLALVGLYGVLSLSVGARIKEIAVRKAIGAQGREIVSLILGEGARLIAVGAVLGAGLAVLLGRVLSALLFEVRPADPLALLGAAGLFGAVALAACAVPAWRAARVDLMDALRHE